MAREVQVQIWCDPCFGQEKREPALDEFTITVVGVMGSKPRVLALCEPHRKEFYDPIVDALTDFSTQAEVAAPKTPKRHHEGGTGTSGPRTVEEREAAGHRCPECDDPFSSRGSLQGHCVRSHGRTLAQLEGQDCPFTCRGEVEGPEGKDVPCPMAFPLPQHRVLHEKKTHGLSLGA